MTLRIWSWLVLLSILWGGSFFFAKVAVGELAPLTVVFARVALAALALDLWLSIRKRSLLRANAPWKVFFVMGLLNNVVPFGLIFWGQTQISSGLASILNASTPLFTLVVAHLSTEDETIDLAKVAALLMGLAGVIVLVSPDASAIASGFWGQMACLGGSFSYALAGVYGRRLRTMGVGPVEAAAGQVTASTVLIVPIMLIVERPWSLPTPPSASVLAALAGLALLSTALAYVLYFRILEAAGATNLLLVTFLIPLTAIILGAAVLGEQLLWRQLAGMILIGCGLALLDGRMTRLLRPAK